MNRLCYIHSDASCLYKKNVLLSQTSTVFNVCRYNNYILKICKCRNCYSCDQQCLHTYIKNCTGKIIRNCKIRVLSKKETIIFELGDMTICEEKKLDLKINSKCFNEKIIVQLLVDNDVASTACVII